MVGQEFDGTDKNDARETDEPLTRAALDVLADPEQLDTMSETVIALARRNPARARDVFDQISDSVEALADQLWTAAVDPKAQDEAAVLIVAGSGKVLAANAQAADRLGAHAGQFADTLGFTPDSHRRLKKLLQVQSEDWTVLRATDLRGQGGEQSSYIALRYNDEKRSSLFVVSINEGWSDALAARIKSIFALSDSEVDVARGLARGLSPAEIAAYRGRSVETVRAQIKALTGKTETGTQAELLRLLSGIKRVSDLLSFVQARPATGEIVAGDSGRVIDYVEYGDPGGRPVLFLHGSIGGREPVSSLHQRFVSDGVRFIAPARPGYGGTTQSVDPAGHMGDTVRDCRALLDHLGISKATVLGYSVGAMMATEFAAAHAGRVDRLVLLSPAVPDFDARKGEHMPVGQRAIALAAHVSPRLIRLLVKMGMQRVSKAGPEGMGRIFFKDAPADLAALEDPQILHALWRAYLFHSSSQVEAFVQDTMLANGGWSLSAKPGCPVDILHGRRDQTVPLDLVLSYTQAMGWPLQLIDQAGHLSFMAAPDQLADLLITQR